MKKTMKWLVTTAALAGVIGSMLPMGQVSAGTRAWASITLPAAPTAAIAARTVISNSDMRAMAVSPNYANDSTILMGVSSDVGNGAHTGDDIAISTNGGRNWTITDPDASSGAGVNPIHTVAFSPNYATDRTLFFLTKYDVYRSTNAGVTWSTLGASPGAGTLVVTSISVAPTYDGTGPIAIGLAEGGDGVAGLPAHNHPATPSGNDDGVKVWGLDGVMNWISPGAALDLDISAVLYSPNYGSDATLLALGHSATVTTLNSISGASTAAAIGWNTGILAAASNVSTDDDFGSTQANATPILSAVMAVAPNFNATSSATRTVWVGTNSASNSAGGDGSSVPVGGGLYKVTAGTAGTASAVRDQIGLGGATSGDVRSISIGGATAAAGTIFVGMVTNSVIFSSNMTSTAPTYTAATTAPVPGPAATGAVKNTVVIATPNFATSATVFAGNMGAGNSTANEQTGFSRSLDSGANFAQISMIDAFSTMTRITDLAINGTTAFLATSDAAVANGGSFNSVWKTTNLTTAPPSWDRVQVIIPAVAAATELILLAMSPAYATDSTLYVVDGTSATGAVIRKTTNGGTSFSATGGAATGAVINAATMLDGNTLIVGTAANGVILRRTTNGGFLWTTPVITGVTGVSSIARSPAYSTDTTVALGSIAGGVYRSTDSGANWSQVGTSAAIGAANTDVVFDTAYVTNGTLYAAGSAVAGIVRWVNGVSSTTWTNLDSSGPIGYGKLSTGFANKALVSGADSALYGASIVASNGVRRSVDALARTALIVDNATAPTFFNINNASTTTGMGAAELGPMALGAGDTIYVVRADQATAVLASYTDTFATPILVPTVLSPKADAGAGIVAQGRATVTIGTITFTWPNVTGATGYQLQVATDSAFASLVTGETALVAAMTTTNTYSLNLTELTANARYWWRVRALIDAAQSIPVIATTDLATRWSSGATDTFIAGATTTGVAIPALITPVLGASGYTDQGNQPTFVWTAVTSATNYELQVSSDGTFAAASTINRAGATKLGNQLAYQDTSVNLLPGVTYFWRVRALIVGATGGDITGAYSPASAFRTTAAAVAGSTTATAFLAALEASGNLELAVGWDDTTNKWATYVPALPGNSLTAITPGMVLIVTMKKDTVVTVSGKVITVPKGSPRPLRVNDAFTYTIG